ncbi:MAG: NLP/P60 hydrolase [Rhodobacteraceae bacterium]|nr:NLP/P60 hydrolase [Paracoccaceae bacterium]
MDRRETPANGRVAHSSLRGMVQADRFTDGEMARVTAPLAEVLAAPGRARDRQALMGARVLVLERRDGWAFVQRQQDGYVGYMAEVDLGPDATPTHRVAAPATHLYPAANLKLREVALLSLGALLTIVGETGPWAETDGGLFVPAQHLRAVDDYDSDPVAVAAELLGTPYLWGGNSRSGIDCSGLVQAACHACGIACPGDTDLQRARLGRVLADGEPLRRGDLVFWKGHVALMADAGTILHANANAMAVSLEPYDAAVARILAAGEGPVLARKRL